MGSALVTGATRGTGRAIACALAEAGWTVWALGRDRHLLDAMRAEFRVIPFALDLTDREEVRAMASSIQPDAVVHAALRWPETTGFQQADEAEIDMAFEVNLSATLHLTRALLPGMQARGRGAVRLISPAPAQAASLIEKTVAGATIAFARGLEQELATPGLSVRVIDPGAAPFDNLARSVVRDLAAGGQIVWPRVSTTSGACL